MSWVIGVESLPNAFPEGCALTMGVFDGVHRGHRALIEATVARARHAGLPAVALTFAPHPATVLTPERQPPLLCTLGHRIERLLRLGIDYVVVQPFNREFAGLSAEQFIEQVLIRGLSARVVVVGDDFRFGRGRHGDVQTLHQAGAFEVITVDGVLDEQGERISSTRLRELIQAGELTRANRLLGEPLHWVGVATHGDGRGRRLGYPTANLVPVEPLITPQEGVYACRVRMETPPPAAPKQPGAYYMAAVSVGKPPMFENARGRVEVYLIDFPDEDLYGRVLTVQFLERLRAQQVFESVDALRHQMAHDVAQARRLAQEVESR